ncbi:MAG: ATP-binding protein, partial [Natronospirillum sp.]
WARQVGADTRESLTESVNFLALSIASTVQYFSALPDNIRPVVLDQQREVGGSRYFMSLNQAPVALRDPIDHDLRTLILAKITDVMTDELGNHNIRAELVMPEHARVVDGGPTLMELPDRWIRQSLILENRPAPLLVVQVKLRDNSWMYLATLLPDPYLLERTQVFTAERWFSLLILLLVVGGLSFWFVRWQTRPLANLALAADAFGRGLDHAPLEDSGLKELDATARAFGVMESRIQRYITDRERLFGAISHDLRTPITRLKLRAEMLDDPTLRTDFEEDLDDLDLMVNGALQLVRESDIHEEPRQLDLHRMLDKLVRDKLQAGYRVRLEWLSEPIFIGKPLALKRCLGNLIDNALHYGKTASIAVDATDAHLHITIRDQGPGIHPTDLNKMFTPYTRLEHGRLMNKNGMGLGLGIARSIIHGHGGELHLSNHSQGGLEAKIILPLSPI